MGLGNLFHKVTVPEGYAKRESGEDIYWKDVDINKLQASRISNPNITNWSINPSGDDRIPVTNSKGAVGGFVHPSTEEVRASLKVPILPQPQYTSGFSQSLTGEEYVNKRGDVSTPSSQVLSNPVQQEVPILEESYNWNPSQYWLGKRASDDESSQVGQIG
jgi:hypothetical protein